MTNEELLQDLKQFIQATVSQEVAPIADKLDTLEKRFDGFEKKLEDIQDGVAETLTHATEPISEAVEDHERRLRKLEKRLA